MIPKEVTYRLECIDKELDTKQALLKDRMSDALQLQEDISKLQKQRYDLFLNSLHRNISE